MGIFGRWFVATDDEVSAVWTVEKSRGMNTALDTTARTLMVQAYRSTNTLRKARTTAWNASASLVPFPFPCGTHPVSESARNRVSRA